MAVKIKNVKQVKNVRNVILKKDFVISELYNLDNFVRSGYRVTRLMINNNKFACDCCNKEVKFILDNKKIKPVVICDSKIVPMSLDHNILKSLGGNNTLSNMTALCQTCNTERGSWFAEYLEFKQYYNDCMKEHGKYIVPKNTNYCKINSLDNIDTLCNNNITGTSTSIVVCTPMINKFKEKYHKLNGFRKVTQLSNYISVHIARNLTDEQFDIIANSFHQHVLKCHGYDIPMPTNHYGKECRHKNDINMTMARISNVLAGTISNELRRNSDPVITTAVVIETVNEPELITKGKLFKFFDKMKKVIDSIF